MISIYLLIKILIGSEFNLTDVFFFKLLNLLFIIIISLLYTRSVIIIQAFFQLKSRILSVTLYILGS